MRAVFPGDEEEFTFTKVEFKVMRSCPSTGVCQYSEMHVATWRRMGEKRGRVGCCQHNIFRRIHAM